MPQYWFSTCPILVGYSMWLGRLDLMLFVWLGSRSPSNLSHLMLLHFLVCWSEGHDESHGRHIWTSGLDPMDLFHWWSTIDHWPDFLQLGLSACGPDWIYSLDLPRYFAPLVLVILFYFSFCFLHFIFNFLLFMIIFIFIFIFNFGFYL